MVRSPSNAALFGRLVEDLARGIAANPTLAKASGGADYERIRAMVTAALDGALAKAGGTSGVIARMDELERRAEELAAEMTEYTKEQQGWRQ
jgi:hypothetical protein